MGVAVWYEKLIFESLGFKRKHPWKELQEDFCTTEIKFHFDPKCYWDQFSEKANLTFFIQQCQIDK